MSEKTAFFIVTAAKTSNLTKTSLSVSGLKWLLSQWSAQFAPRCLTESVSCLLALLCSPTATPSWGRHGNFGNQWLSPQLVSTGSVPVFLIRCALVLILVRPLTWLDLQPVVSNLVSKPLQLRGNVWSLRLYRVFLADRTAAHILVRRHHFTTKYLEARRQ
jgi:hypothetical protein